MWRLAMLLLPAIGLSAEPRHTVTVLLDFEQPHSSVSVKTMRDEANHLLKSSGINLDVKDRSEVPREAEFSNVLVFKMTGHCAVEPNPALYDERGSLAEAYVVDGQVQSFGEIHCEQIKAVIQKSPRGGFALGTALGRVLAHETYHMLGNLRAHTKKGVTRRTLSPEDLSELGPFIARR